MGKVIFLQTAVVWAALVTVAYSQTNFNGTNSGNGTSGTSAWPMDGTSGQNFGNAPNENMNSSGTDSNIDNGGANTQQSFDGSAAVDNNWRMVQHNGHWWYWTPENTWLLRRGNDWQAYQDLANARQNRMQQNSNRQRQRVGFRGDGQANLQGSDDSNLNRQSTFNNGTNAQGSIGTNFNSTGFDPNRPPLPTGDELQRFQAHPQSTATPFGGTMGGARNGTVPLGGGNSRSGTAVGNLGFGGTGTSGTFPSRGGTGAAAGAVGNTGMNGGANTVGGVGGGATSGAFQGRGGTGAATGVVGNIGTTGGANAVGAGATSSSFQGRGETGAGTGTVGNAGTPATANAAGGVTGTSINGGTPTGGAPNVGTSATGGASGAGG